MLLVRIWLEKGSLLFGARIDIFFAGLFFEQFVRYTHARQPGEPGSRSTPAAQLGSRRALPVSKRPARPPPPDTIPGARAATTESTCGSKTCGMAKVDARFFRRPAQRGVIARRSHTPEPSSATSYPPRAYAPDCEEPP